MHPTFSLTPFAPLLLVLVGCAGTGHIYQETPVGLETLVLGEVQGNPKQVTATLTGYSGLCERLEVRQRRDGATFWLSVVGIYEGPADASCPAIAREYTEAVTLELVGLEADIYTVRAGDLTETFLLITGPWTPYETDILSVEVALLESYPVQVAVTAEGYLTNGCDKLGDVTQRREGNTFFVTILGLAPTLPDYIACTPAGANFTERLTLQTAELAPGEYLLSVNGVEQTFTLP